MAFRQNTKLSLFGKVKNFFNKNRAIILILFLGFCVYLNALPDGFVWDDQGQIVNNLAIREWGSLTQFFSSSTFYGESGLYGSFYRPLVSLAYLLDYKIWELNAFGFRLFQVAVHLFDTALVFLLIKKILEVQRVDKGDKIAALAALLFVVHPANVESVTFLGSVGEVLYTMFVLLALLVLIDGVDRQGRSVRDKNLSVSLALVFCGLLAKETAVVVLPIIFLYLLLFVRPKLSTYVKFVAGSGLVAGIYMVLRVYVAHIHSQGYLSPIAAAPIGERLLTIPYELVSYLGIIFFPRYLSISRQFVVHSAADPRFWASFIFLAVLGAATGWYVYRKRSLVLAFFALWSVVSLAPALNIIPLEMTVAERWLYFPIIGVLAFVGIVAIDTAKGLSALKQKIGLGVLALVVLALFALTVARNGNWKDNLALYSHDAAIESKVSPDGSFDLENNYGDALFRAGRIEEAKAHIERSIALQPMQASAICNLGAVLQYEGDLAGAEALFRKAAKSNYYPAYEDLGGVLIKEEKYDEAKDFLIRSLVMFPADDRLKLQLAALYAADNVSKDENDKQKARDLLSDILRDDPQNSEARQLLHMIDSGMNFAL